MRALSVAILSLLIPSCVMATTRHVPGDFSSIQAALNASTSGDVVSVAAGTYHEHLTLGLSQSGVQLVSESGPNVTTIDGDGTGRVITCSSLGSTTLIEGFTITHGAAFGLSNLGGGLSLYESNLTLRGNWIEDNSAEAAGGLYIDYSSPTLTDNLIVSNSAQASAGGLYCDHFSNATIQRNVISDNTCGHYGGGVSIWVGSSPILSENTVVANSSALGGGGIWITRNSHPSVDHTIVAENSQGGGIVIGDTESTIGLDCNDVWSNAGGNYIGLIDPTGSSSNFSADPLFCDFQAGDFTLHLDSPCSVTNSPFSCGLVGAKDVGCSNPTAVKRTSWGQIKALGLEK